MNLRFVAVALALLALSPARATENKTARYRATNSVVANGVTQQYVDWSGKGETLLLLAGLGNDAYIFDSFAPRFTDKFHVIALTRRGFGGSDKPGGGYDTATRVEDVRAFLDTLKIRRVVLVGHSLAGDEMTLFCVEVSGSGAQARVSRRGLQSLSPHDGNGVRSFHCEHATSVQSRRCCMHPSIRWVLDGLPRDQGSRIGVLCDVYAASDGCQDYRPGETQAVGGLVGGQYGGEPAVEHRNSSNGTRAFLLR